MLDKAILLKHFDGVVNQIETEVGLRSRFDGDGTQYHSYDAIWDTGAMSSCLSPKIAEEIGLFPIDTILIRGVGNNATIRRPVYLVDLKVSSGMVIRGVKIIGVEIAGGDVLIGMDVISRGNFSIFHDKQGDMNMSFTLI